MPLSQPASLPNPSAEAVVLSEALVADIVGAVSANGGWLPFDRYMDRALYAPGLGYYTAGSVNFGAAGDFVTAPELGTLFSLTLARQLSQVLEHLRGGDILEFGAGSGVLAANLLAELERLGTLPEHYFILELSPDLRERQREAIAARAPAVLSRVTWLTRWPEAPLRGVVLANEVLDAMPIRVFELDDGKVLERGVGLSAKGLDWVSRQADAEFEAAVRQLLPLPLAQYPMGYRGELNERMMPWFERLGMMLGQGLVLLIDYGGVAADIYRPARINGTLRTYYRQRLLEAPFWRPGLCDLTADVNFTAVALAAEGAGFEVAGFAPQSQILLTGGLETVFGEAFAATTDEIARIRLTQEVKHLTLPDEMGERFWGLALVKDYAGPLPGFEARDYRYRLELS